MFENDNLYQKILKFYKQKFDLLREEIIEYNISEEFWRNVKPLNATIQQPYFEGDCFYYLEELVQSKISSPCNKKINDKKIIVQRAELLIKLQIMCILYQAQNARRVSQITSISWYLGYYEKSLTRNKRVNREFQIRNIQKSGKGGENKRNYKSEHLRVLFAIKEYMDSKNIKTGPNKILKFIERNEEIIKNIIKKMKLKTIDNAKFNSLEDRIEFYKKNKKIVKNIDKTRISNELSRIKITK